MNAALAISVRLHEGWYHGAGSMPSPARLFQALIAGRGLSGPLPVETIEALEWLEQQAPPVLATPFMHRGQSVTTFVPNNDLDAKKGDHRRIGEIRTKKTIHPLVFDGEVPFLYCWELSGDEVALAQGQQISGLADGLYQLGRAVDAAWAWAEVLTSDALEEKLNSHRGPVLRPSPGRGSVECPTSGSVASLLRRHGDMSKRYALTTEGPGQTFRRRSKPKWRMVSYAGAQTCVSFDLVDRSNSAIANWTTTSVLPLVKQVRDAAVSRLVQAMPTHEREIKQCLIGRTRDGENSGPVTSRVRLVPLPSIGHQHADRQIRRIAIVVPGDCTLRTDDITWAFSGLPIQSSPKAVDLVRSQPHRQLEYYGFSTKPSSSWQTVTPIVLGGGRRRRIEPNPDKRSDDERKGAATRRFEEDRAAYVLRQSLRQAGVSAKLVSYRLQREPFTGSGSRVEDFVLDNRFDKHSLWHASLTFDRPIQGPLMVGDGRFMGLGLLQPKVTYEPIVAFSIESGLANHPDPVRLSRSLRRAVMARVGAHSADRIPTYFSGHTASGRPADSVTEPHLSYAFDPSRRRLLVIQPSFSETGLHQSKPHQRTLELACVGLTRLRAGKDGDLRLARTMIDETTDPILASASVWTSLTPYQVNRHAKKVHAEEAIRRDVLEECQRRRIPHPRVTVLSWSAARGLGLQASLKLQFDKDISGPIMLGKTRHHGGGLFGPDDSD